MKKSKICIAISIALLFVFCSTAIFATSESTESAEEVKVTKEQKENILKGLVGGDQFEIMKHTQKVSSDTAGVDGKEATTTEGYYLKVSADLGNYFDGESKEIKIGSETCELGLGFYGNEGNLVRITADQITEVSDDDGNIEYYELKITSNRVDIEEMAAQKKLVCFLESTDFNENEEKIVTTDKKKAKIKEVKETIGDKTSLVSAAWDIIAHGSFTGLGRILVETLVTLLLSFGDGFLHMIAKAVGELVTIDGIVFGYVKKISINFWESEFIDSAVRESSVAPLRDPLSNVINHWYSIFLTIVILLYVVQLVYIGLKILLSSTANKKAEFKTRLSAWFAGVAILLCFPYAMKYTIEANAGFCTMIGAANGTADPPIWGEEVNIANMSINELKKDYGTFAFIAKAMGYDSYNSLAKAVGNKTGEEIYGNNAMLAIRHEALGYFSVPLSIVYLILIGETIALLIMYYKRVFMLAFLITIFPLTVTFYALNKMGDVRVNSFGAWFKEFLILVLVQAFHAATYVVVVNVGVTAYTKSGNWMFMIVCILFLFQGEKIIRAIFNANSSAGTIGDIAKSGAIAMNALKGISKLPGKPKDKSGNDENADKVDEKSDEKAQKDREKASKAVNQTPTQGAQQNLAAANAANSGGSSAGAGQNGGSGAGDSEVKLGRRPATSHQEIYKKVNKKIDKAGKASKSKIKGFLKASAKGAVRYTAGITASAIGGTFALAQHKDAESIGGALAVAANSFESGKKFGDKAFDAVDGFAKKRRMNAYGKVLAQEYLDGKHDDEFVVDEADEELKKKKIEAYRKIAAKVASDRRKYGKDAAEKVFISEQLNKKE